MEPLETVTLEPGEVRPERVWTVFLAFASLFAAHLVGGLLVGAGFAIAHLLGTAAENGGVRLLRRILPPCTPALEAPAAAAPAPTTP